MSRTAARRVAGRPPSSSPRWLRGAMAAALLAGCSAEHAPAQAQRAGDVSGSLRVANKRGNSLSRIDLATGEPTHETNSCANPHELAVSPDRRHVALACYSGEELEIF